MYRLLPLLLLGACAKPQLRALLDDASGLSKGSRVYAAGVSVGEVESVRVVDTRAEVSIALRAGNSLSPRLDACAMSLPDEQGALLVLFPGKELERLAPRPIPACGADEQRLTALKQLASSGGGALSQAIHRFLAERQEPLLPAAGSDEGACGALAVSRLRIEPVSAVPLLLPSGGKRLWLSVENRSENPVSLVTATFLDARGTVAPQERVPEPADLFESVSLAPHTRREVSAIFAGSKANQVSAVEMKAAFVDSQPGSACSVRWPL